jgi:hypothetical protein
VFGYTGMPVTAELIKKEIPFSPSAALGKKPFL